MKLANPRHENIAEIKKEIRMFETRFTKMFGIKYPIMAGAMGHESRAELVSAVSNAGGLGSLMMAGFENLAELRDEVRKTKRLTNKPFAINLPFLPGRRPISHEQMVEVIVEEGIPAVETIAAGRLPENILKTLKQNGVKIIHKCNQVKYAKSAEDQGVDAVAILGYGSDGHPGLDEISHLVIIPKAVQTLKIPVIVAGGIADGRGLVAALALGAEGVLMGTRFLTAKECSFIHPIIRDWLVKAQETDTIMVDVTHGIPARRAKTKASLKAVELEKSGAPLEEILNIISGPGVHKALMEGDLDAAAFGCGQVIGLIDEILPAKEIIDRMISEATSIIGRLGSLAKRT